MADMKQIVEKRLKGLEESASGLRALLEEQRKKEEPGILFALSGYSGTPKEVEAEKRYVREEAERLEAKYQPLETAINNHIHGLAAFKSDIEGMIQTEGKPQFWSGFLMNAFFFVLGLGVSAFSLSGSEVWALLGWK